MIKLSIIEKTELYVNIGFYIDQSNDLICKITIPYNILYPYFNDPLLEGEFIYHCKIFNSKTYGIKYTSKYMYLDNNVIHIGLKDQYFYEGQVLHDLETIEDINTFPVDRNNAIDVFTQCSKLMHDYYDIHGNTNNVIFDRYKGNIKINVYTHISNNLKYPDDDSESLILRDYIYDWVLESLNDPMKKETIDNGDLTYHIENGCLYVISNLVFPDHDVKIKINNMYINQLKSMFGY